jgi:hypothetical protein
MNQLIKNQIAKKKWSKSLLPYLISESHSSQILLFLYPIFIGGLLTESYTDIQWCFIQHIPTGGVGMFKTSLIYLPRLWR